MPTAPAARCAVLLPALALPEEPRQDLAVFPFRNFCIQVAFRPKSSTMRIFGLKATLYAHNCAPQGAKPRNIRIFTTKVTQGYGTVTPLKIFPLEWEYTASSLPARRGSP